MKHILLFLVPLAMSLSSVRAQSLTLSFKDNDETMLPATAIPALSTGSLEGSFTYTTGAGEGVPGEEGGGSSPVLAYAWGYYVDGELYHPNISPTNSPTESFYYTFSPGPTQRLFPIQHTYNVSLPLGDPGYPSLPIGVYTLRLWVGDSAIFQVGPTGEPIMGVFASYDVDLVTTDVPFAVSTGSPRRLVVGELTEFQLLMSEPATTDLYFELMSDTPIITLGQSSTMIQQGNTASAVFLAFSDTLGEGKITAARDDGVVISSSLLQFGDSYEFFDLNAESGPISDPVTHSFSYCNHPGKPFRPTGVGSSECASGCSQILPGICIVGQNADAYGWSAGSCRWALSSCVIFTATKLVPGYRVTSTFTIPCDANGYRFDGSLEVDTKIVKVKLNGEIISDPKLKLRACCSLAFVGSKNKLVTVCQ